MMKEGRYHLRLTTKPIGSRIQLWLKLDLLRSFSVLFSMTPHSIQPPSQ